MVNSNADVLSIIFPNSYDNLVPELVGERLMASIPFAGRYRMIDFILSSLVNCGIGNVSIIVRKNYHSLMDHLGSGREWDLARKNGGLNIVPPFAQKTVKVYNGRVEALSSILQFLKRQKEKYVIMSDTNIAVNFDFTKLISAHIETGADVTMTYAKMPIPKGHLDTAMDVNTLYYTLMLDGDRVKKMYVSPQVEGEQNLYMNICIIGRELLIEQITAAFMRGYIYFERDILAPNLDKMDVRAFEFNGYLAYVADIQSYFQENMRLLKEENLDGLFAAHPVYTKIRDDNPTRYISGAKVKNIMAADGCLIEGEVENSILFRGVKVGKGAKVKNCVLMQDTVIQADAQVEYMITDKNVTVTSGKEVIGTDTFPVYVAKRQVV